MRQIVLIAHNLRSAHNVGSLLRTAEGLGVQKVYLTGYSPYPKQIEDTRLPHIANKVHDRIAKTALGAESTISHHQQDDVFGLIKELRDRGYTITALEQSPKAVNLTDYKPEDKIVLIVGSEVEGIEPEVLETVNEIIQIPMFGKKESFNVAQAAAMALYHLKFTRDWF